MTKREFKHIRKDFNSYADLNAFCIKCRSYPRGMCDCDTKYDFYLNGKYSGSGYLFYNDNHAFISILNDIRR